MELSKRNIHMEQTLSEANLQFALEEDVNIPETKADIHTIELVKGTVEINGVHSGNDYVTVKGVLQYCLLYHTTETGCPLVPLKGQLPFEEKVSMAGVQTTDAVTAEGMAEDVSCVLINSRKISIRSLICLKAQVKQLTDVEAPVALKDGEAVEYRQAPVETVQLVVSKGDVYRMREEITLPNNHPNLSALLWDSVTLSDMDCRVASNQLAISGDVHVFFLYEGEDRDGTIGSYEAVIPVNGFLDCHGVREGMIPSVQYKIGQKELAIRPDEDGEERLVSVELTLEMSIHVYEEETIDLVTDLYGVQSEVITKSHKTMLPKLLPVAGGRKKLAEKVRIKDGKVLSLLHSEGSVTLETQAVRENGIALEGVLNLQVLYVGGEDDSPYGCKREAIPWNYLLEMPGLSPQDTVRVEACVEQLQTTMLDSEEMDVKAYLVFSVICFQQQPVELIDSAELAPIDAEKKNALPGISIYLVKDGDNLWNIGKKYYCSVDSIRKRNELESDELHRGQKLLIVKECAGKL